jgi:molybdenum-dependent DNA-binding transcriptional regulator ModE
MAAESTRGDRPGNIRDIHAPSGWVTTQQAARALGISARTVRWHIDKGNLEAKTEGEGVKRTWLVSIDSLQEFRDSRQPTVDSPRDIRVSAKGAEISPESLGNPIRELADRLAEEAARAAEYRVRLELTEQAQSTLEEELESERRRREDAEHERDELAAQLEALGEPRNVPETAAEGEARGDTPPGNTEEPRTSWWQRWFGG